ncbi:hypothetical protein ACQPW1_21660 [Nocardia sp. CA-128927]|uniref:hypothetical protein n=1 Tax=Nocardia sp. CA-128927 TaxID=3239975 RepID=UPI003D963F91
MARTPRDRTAEASAINAATDRLLAGTPLRSASGKLTISELIAESGLRRDVVYEHPGLVDLFKARAKAQDATPAAMQELADENRALHGKNDKLTYELTTERGITAALRKIAAELSLELDQAKGQLSAATAVTQLNSRHRNQ